MYESEFNLTGFPDHSGIAIPRDLNHTVAGVACRDPRAATRKAVHRAPLCALRRAPQCGVASELSPPVSYS